MAVSIEHARRDRPTADIAPAELVEALAGEPGAAEAFDGLSFSHRREYVQWITEAKRPETRARRVAGTIERLHEGKPLR